MLAHLPMGDADGSFGQQLRQHFLGVADGIDVIVQKVHLSATFEFSQHRFTDQRFGKA